MKNDSQYCFAGIIPARFASARFPGKPLALIGNKPMVQMVYEQASKALESVFVATDDERIFNAVISFGGKAIMTSPEHRSGTDRCAEAAEIICQSTPVDVVINIQGDEPFIRPEQIGLLKSCFHGENTEIATLIREVGSDEDLFDPNQPKAVINSNGDALYFSRSVIPFLRGVKTGEWAGQHTYFKHIGIYAYKTGILKKITALPQSKLEIAESLEQNRWLENGFKIRTAITSWQSIGIDTPEDLKKANVIVKEFK
jgi:3-deoxy-manno-octulosonate cytidylyltransferase (CMP-KDO synthetase)